jgi:hypothetical protein
LARQVVRFDPQVLHGVSSPADQRRELPIHNRIADLEMAVDSAARRGLESQEVATTGCWLVSGTNGENRIHAVGESQAAAWQLATQQAAAVGMLGA